MVSINSIFKRNNWILIFYGILVFILTSWRSLDSAPPMLYRLVFLALLIVPVFFQKDILPAVLTCFVSIAFYGYAYSYLPTMLYIYVGIVVVMSFFTYDKTRMPLPIGLILFTVYVTLVNMGVGGRIEEISDSFLIVLLFYLMVGRRDAAFFERMSLAYAVLSFVLSIFFLTSFEMFAVSYGGAGEDLERGGWTDPNYFGTVLGMGTVFAALQLFGKPVQKRLLRFFYIAVIGISVVSLVINASRGAIVAVAGALAVMMLLSNTKRIYKVLVLLVGSLFLIFIYNSGLMDLLIYRSMDATASTAGGRVGIWTNKLNFFFNGDFAGMLFGYGTLGGLNLTGHNLGFHNDFVATLVDFGIIGLVIFVFVFLAPVFKVMRAKSPARLIVYVLSSYLFLCMMSLEPVTAGRLPYVVILFVIYIVANQDKYLIEDKKIQI